MKKSSLMKACFNACFLFTLVFLLFSSQSFAAAPAGKATGRVIKGAKWLNFPYAINGQRTMSFCADEVTETSIIPASTLRDQDYVCRCQTYRFTVPLSCATISWGLYNAAIVYSYSAYDKLITFTNGITVDGYANVWVTVIDPLTGDPYSYEFAFFDGQCCE